MSRIEFGPAYRENSFTRTKKKIRQTMDNPRQFRKVFRTFNAFLVGSIFSTSVTMCNDAMERENHADAIKKEVRATGISEQEFKKLDNSISFWNSRDKAVSWQKALDSIKTKGVAEKAYHEGAQMVRDSLRRIK